MRAVERSTATCLLVCGETALSTFHQGLLELDSSQELQNMLVSCKVMLRCRACPPPPPPPPSSCQGHASAVLLSSSLSSGRCLTQAQTLALGSGDCRLSSCCLLTSLAGPPACRQSPSLVAFELTGSRPDGLLQVRGVPSYITRHALRLDHSPAVSLLPVGCRSCRSQFHHRK